MLQVGASINFYRKSAKQQCNYKFTLLLELVRVYKSLVSRLISVFCRLLHYLRYSIPHLKQLKLWKFRIFRFNGSRVWNHHLFISADLDLIPLIVCWFSGDEQEKGWLYAEVSIFYQLYDFGELELLKFLTIIFWKQMKLDY